MSSKSVTMALVGAKAFSVNRMSCRDARFKTKEFKDWYTITREMIINNPNYGELLCLAEDLLDNHKLIISFRMNVAYPENIFTAGNGVISSKTMDCSNVEKPLVDLVIGDIMGINDKRIVLLTSEKCPALDYSIEIVVEVL
jgi:hypothetical protein